MSRVHPGRSGAYNKKMMTRIARESERELLKLAKEKHALLFGSRAPIDRVKIRRFKREIRESIKRNS